MSLNVVDLEDLFSHFMQKIYFDNALHVSITIEWSKVWIRCHRLSYSNIGTPMLIHSNRDGGGKLSEKNLSKTGYVGWFPSGIIKRFLLHLAIVICC